jgi:hypothetical protein
VERVGDRDGAARAKGGGGHSQSGETSGNAREAQVKQGGGAHW